MEYLAVGIIGFFAIIWLVSYMRDERSRTQRRRAYQVKVLQSHQKIRPIVETAHKQLTEDIRAKYPFLRFSFPTISQLLASSQDYKGFKAPLNDHMRLAKSVLNPIVKASVNAFMDSNVELKPIEDFQSTIISDNLWEYEEKYIVTQYGRSPEDWPKRRKAVYNRDGGQCRRCGNAVSLETCHIHHIIRRFEGGDHSLQNLITLCRDYHRLMFGHAKMDGGPFYVSRLKIHTKDCSYRIYGHPSSLSLPVLIAQGYEPCLKCMETGLHGFRIGYFVGARIKAIVESAMASSADSRSIYVASKVNSTRY